MNGRASEDRDEWTEEVRAHCEKCHDDKTETSEVQAERIRYQRSRGDSLAHDNNQPLPSLCCSKHVPLTAAGLVFIHRFFHSPSSSSLFARTLQRRLT